MSKSNSNSFIKKIADGCSSFIKGVKTEFGKIIWPDKESVAKQTATVVIITIILALIIVLLDAGIQTVLDKVIA